MAASPRLSLRDRRALLGGGIVLALLVAGARGLPAWRGWGAVVAASAAELRVEERSARRDAVAVAAIEDSARAARRSYVALAPTLLGADNHGSAAAELGGLLAGAAALSELRLGAVQFARDSLPRPFLGVRATASATGDVRGLVSFLRALEGGPTRVVVRSLSVTQPEPAALPDRPESLRIEFEVAALALEGRR
jgi:hypothetical protein